MKASAPAQPPSSHPSGNPAESRAESWFDAIGRGDFEAAWRVNDRVLAGRDPAARDDLGQPYHMRWVWDGRPFEGRRVLVRCYHGLGDTLQFCRYLAPLRARVRSLALEVQPALIPLMAPLPGPDRLIPFRPEAPSPPAECDLEIMELAHALRLRPEPKPYLDAPGAPGPRGAGFRVGLCWQASLSWAPERSVPLPLLGPLAAIPRVTLFSLQRGPAAAELRLPGAPAVANPGDDSEAILDTARLIRAMDVVVTVDTMVAHLAGGLGVPVWLLLHAEPDWRWRAGGRGSPWYRGIRKYQQGTAGDWTSPIRELTADLTQAARGHSVAGT